MPETTTLRRRLPPPRPRRPPRHRDRPGRTPGGDYPLQRGRLNPYHRLFGRVTSRARRHRHYQPVKINLTQRGAVDLPVPDLGERELTVMVVTPSLWPCATAVHNLGTPQVPIGRASPNCAEWASSTWLPASWLGGSLGCSRWGGRGWAGGGRGAVVQGVSLSGGDHQSLCLALPPLSRSASVRSRR